MNNSSERIASLSLSKLALLSNQTYSRVEDILNAEPIAVIGMGCRFPGDANSPEAFWDLMVRKESAMTEVPADRWNIDTFYDSDFAAPGKMNNRKGGFLKEIDTFDPAFFGIPQREANQMDPQQRLALEVAIEALDDAGLSHEQIRGSQGGVFVSSYHNDYSHLVYSNLPNLDLRTLTGTLHCITANRISYLLDLHGPSMVIDTACSSSLLVVHMACQSLRNRESDLCLAGGVNVIVTPGISVSLSKVGFISPSGYCKTFDESADGFVRSEGCGMVVLKRLSDAIAHGDRILAVIRGSAINQDGRTTVLTAPNGQAQQAVVRRAIKNAGLSVDQISMIETHGTGTHLGDPLEVEALAAVIGPQQSEDHQCALTSVKANIGHLEAAAGIAGLIKVVLSLQHGAIPGHPTFTRLNHNISLDNTPFYIPTEMVSWPAGAKGRYAGVSSFGVGGTNAHVILGEAPQLPVNPSPERAGKTFFLPISACSPQALVQRLEQYEMFLQDPSQDNLYDICYTASLRRSHFEYRLGITGANCEQMVKRLNALLQDRSRLAEMTKQETAEQAPRLAFVFSGQGTQWSGMARILLEQEPVFHKVIEQCDEVLYPLAGWSLLEKLSAAETDLNQTEVAQPAIFAVQIALAALWKSWGVTPDAVVGHSLGEIAAAYAAGVLTLEESVFLVYHRGRLMQGATGYGKMVSVNLNVEEVRRIIGPYADNVSVAAINAPKTTVISGSPEAVDAVMAILQTGGVAFTLLKVNYAFHSPQMEPYAQDLSAVLSDWHGKREQLPWISTVTGESVRGEALEAAYWGENIRQPVRFAQAMEHLFADGVTLFLEIGPHPALSSMIEESARDRGKPTQVRTLHSMRRNKPEAETLREALSGLYQAGVPIRWQVFFPVSVLPVVLPAYPWQHKRCWLEDEQSGSQAQGEAESGHALLGSAVHSPAFAGILFQKTISSTSPAYLTDHRVFGEAVLPAAGQLEMAFSAAAALNTVGPFQFEDFHFQEALHLPDNQARAVQVLLQPAGDGETTVSIYSREGESNWNLHTTGKVRQAQTGSPETQPESLEAIRARCHEIIEGSDYYTEQNQLDGVSFGPAFQGIGKIWRRDGEALAQITLPEPLSAGVGQYIIHPALLDSALQPLTAALIPEARQNCYLPVEVGLLRQFSELPQQLWSHVTVNAVDQPGRSLICSVQLYAQNGDLLLEINGFVIKQVNPVSLRRAFQRGSDRSTAGAAEKTQPDISDYFYQIHWEPAQAVPASAADLTGQWVVFADRNLEMNSVSSAVRSKIKAMGGDCLVVLPGPAYASPSNGIAQINPARADDYQRLMKEMKTSAPLRGFLHLWSLDIPALDGTTSLVENSFSGSGSALYLTQALLTSGVNAQASLWLVTCGTQPARRVSTAPEQAPIWGLANTLFLEQPELRCTCIDLDPYAAAEDQAQHILAELADQSREDRIAYHQGLRLAARLVKTRLTQAAKIEKSERLSIGQIGNLETISVQPAARRAPGPGEVEIQVQAAGLNFRDVLKAFGRYPGQERAEVLFGDECAGKVSAVGSGVTGLQVGDPVLALASGAFASFVTTTADLVVLRPAGLSPEEAASLPIPFLTAWYTLYHLAQLKAGQRVLIHAAAGGVGLAAVQLAKRVGAVIYATAGSRTKRAYLQGLGVEHVYDSRSLDFAEAILQETDGQGVDVVLNSLAGDFIAKSLSVVAQHGCFLEIGKTGILTDLEAAQARPDIAYYPVYLGEQFTQDPALIRSMLAEILSAVQARELTALPRRVFPMESAPEAFRFMARARHIGKIVMTMPALADQRLSEDLPLFRSDSTYLVTGGLGGIGRVITRWMVARGARSLAIASRSGVDHPEAQQFIHELQSAGAVVKLYRVDVGCFPEVQGLMEAIRASQPVLRGVFHIAGINEDHMLLQQNWESFQRVMAGKADGAWNLHQLTRQLSMDHFVLFSSIAGSLGSAGQANYSAANSFLSALAAARAAEGLPAVCVDWGAWDETGMTARLRLQDQQSLLRRGLRMISHQDGTRALELAVRQARTHVLILPVDWAAYLNANNQKRSFFQEIQRETVVQVKKTQSGAASTTSLLRRLVETPYGQRMSRVIAYIHQEVIHLAGLEPDLEIDSDQPLNSLGLDSLMAVEMRNAISTALGKSLSATLLFDYPTSRTLAKYLMDTIPDLRAGANEFDQPAHAAGTTQSEDQLTDSAIEQLSDEEAELELLAELARLKKGS